MLDKRKDLIKCHRICGNVNFKRKYHYIEALKCRIVTFKGFILYSNEWQLFFI